jgi:hypothetical protein
VTITFSEAVTGFTNADLTVANGTLSAVSSSDGGITWTATLTPSSAITDATNVITLDNTGVADLAGNAGAGTTDSNNYAIDTQAPAITAASVPESGYYVAGQTLNFTVSLSESVTLDTSGGTPYLALVMGGTTVHANYVSGSGSNILNFAYTIQPGDNAADGIHLPSAISLNNATVRDQAGNDTATALHNAADTTGIIIDTTAPQAASLTLTDETTANALSYTLTLSEPVTGIDASDFSVVTTGDASATIQSVTEINNHTYRIDLTQVSGTGSVQLTLNNTGTHITDVAGNAIAQGLSGEIHTNHAPTTAGIGTQTVNEDSTLSFVIPANSFTDTDVGDSLHYTATLADGSPLPAWLSFNAATRTFGGTPANGDVGTLSIRVTATDHGSVSVSTNFTLVVVNTNDAPTTTGISNQTIASGNALSFSLPNATFADVDQGDSLTLTATQANGSSLPGWLSFNAATKQFSGTPTNFDIGTLSVLVTATDTAGASVSTTFTITVGQSSSGVDPEFKVTDGAADSSQQSTATTPQSQLSLLTTTATGSTINTNTVTTTPLFTSTTLSDTTPATATVFSSVSQRGGATVPSAIASVFSVVTGSVDHQDLGGPHSGNTSSSPVFGGASTLAGLFGGLNLPGNTPLEVFSGGSWNQVMHTSTLPSAAPVFGVSVFSLQLKELDKDEQQIAEIENALKNITQLPV